VWADAWLDRGMLCSEAGYPRGPSVTEGVESSAMVQERPSAEPFRGQRASSSRGGGGGGAAIGAYPPTTDLLDYGPPKFCDQLRQPTGSFDGFSRAALGQPAAMPGTFVSHPRTEYGHFFPPQKNRWWRPIFCSFFFSFGPPWERKQTTAGRKALIFVGA